MSDLEAIRQTFFQECEEQLAELESGLMSMSAGDVGAETVNAVFRSVHSIKGGAGAFGLDALVRFAHVFETALDEVRAGRLASSPALLEVMLRAADALTDLVQAARKGEAADPVTCSDLADELRKLSGSETELVDANAAVADDGMDGLSFQPIQVIVPDPSVHNEWHTTWHIRLTPFAAMYMKANETGLLLRELKRLGDLKVSLDRSALPPFDRLEPEEAYLSWDLQLITQAGIDAIREVFEFVEDDCLLEIKASSDPLDLEDPVSEPPIDTNIELLLQRIQATVEEGSTSEVTPTAVDNQPSKTEPVVLTTARASGPRVAPGAGTIRVDLDRIDRLIDVVGELVINQAMLGQRISEAGLARASEVTMALDELEQLTREIQDSVMAIRAQPVGSVFSRMPRLVREVAALTGKSVRLVTDGEATEVDKTVIERLADPLTHMIRNAIDHGLESSQRRLDAGKPAEGVVRLSASHRSGRIVIEVADDGGGIDRSTVKAIAVKRGLIEADAVLSDEEADNLIFLPGFSTAATISDVSGRGVGMDVVKRSVQQLGGRISIASRPGHGCTFTLSLPLTLAVLDGMVVTACGQPLVIPLTAIVETMQLKRSDIHGLCNNARVINIRDRFLPIVDVGHALGYRESRVDHETGVIILVENESGDHAALQIDAIQGQRQVVIKSLEANCGRVPGIAAATVLGDGRVALILDVDVIISSVRAEHARSKPNFSLAG